MVYERLRGLAAIELAGPAGGSGIDPTELVHEVYVRLNHADGVDWAGRTHFLAVSATAMRRILVDEARRRRAFKRGGGRRVVTLDERVAPGSTDRDIDVLALDEALGRLAGLHERQAKIVELRFFAGMSVEDCAEAIGVSRRTVLGDWSMARAWLRRELSRGAV